MKSKFKEDAIKLTTKSKTSIDFANKQVRRTKTYHDEKQQDFVIESAKDRFKISVYYTVLDVFIATLCNRFSDFNSLCQKFSCLVDFKNCEENIKCLMDLQLSYGKDVNSSIIDEYQIFCNLLIELRHDGNNLRTEEILHFIMTNHLDASYPVLTVLLKIFFTIPTNSAWAERWFSRLNKILNFQRCSMTQERINNLSLLSIESEKAQLIDYDKLLNKLKSLKTRRLKF